MSFRRDFILIKNFYELVVSIDLSLHCTGEVYSRYISTESIIEISDLTNSSIFTAIENVVTGYDEEEDPFFDSKESSIKNDMNLDNDEDDEENISGIEVVSIDEKSLALYTFIYEHRDMTLLKTSQNIYYFLDYIKPETYYERYIEFCNKSFIFN